MTLKPFTILSVGGSIVVPDTIDTRYLKALRTMILRLMRQGHRFVIVVGGGQTNRDYNNAITSIRRVKDMDLDWLGIAATKLNAELVRILFAEKAYPEIMSNPGASMKGNPKLIIGAGWKPGSSTDKDAVLWAIRLGAKRIINLTDINYVYDRDPGRYKAAKPIRSLPWREYRSLFQTKWSPRLSTPFGPSGSLLAQKKKLAVAVLNGRKLENVEQAIREKPFTGTLIS